MLKPITLAAMLAVPCAGHALTVTKSASWSLSGYDSAVGETALIDYFDPSLGTLDSATFELRGVLSPAITFLGDMVPATSPFDARESVFANLGIIPLAGSAKSFTDGHTEPLGFIQTGPQAYRSIGGDGFSFDFQGAITTTDATGPGQFAVTFGGGSAPVLIVGEFYDASPVVARIVVTYNYTPGDPSGDPPSDPPTSVPEPMGAALLPAGLLGLLAVRRGRG